MDLVNDMCRIGYEMLEEKKYTPSPPCETYALACVLPDGELYIRFDESNIFDRLLDENKVEKETPSDSIPTYKVETTPGKVSYACPGDRIVYLSDRLYVSNWISDFSAIACQDIFNEAIFGKDYNG